MPAPCSSLPSQGHAYFMGNRPYNDGNSVDVVSLSSFFSLDPFSPHFYLTGPWTMD